MTIRVPRATIADAKTIVDFNFAIAKETERLDLDRKTIAARRKGTPQGCFKRILYPWRN